ncbi:MAG: hypothetical protein HUJ25_04150 [Crocinitomicaceae bacterium]|nr:hypothetical protein [Crocinitomicaceae bacterium]
MKKLITTLSFLSCLNIIYAQGTQNPVWTLPHKSAGSGYYNHNLDTYRPFPTVDPVTLVPYSDVIGTDGGYTPTSEEFSYWGASNGYVDLNDELLFFIIGDNIFDRDGRTIWGDFVDFGIDNKISSGYSDICVVPNPGNCNQYYLFSTRETEVGQVPINPISYANDHTRTEAYYAILDISVQNDGAGYNDCAKGRLIQPWQSLVTFAGLGHSPSNKLPHTSFAASPEELDGSRVIITITNALNPDPEVDSYSQLLKFRLDASGLTFVGSDQIFDGSNSLSGGNRDYPKRRSELEMVKMTNGNFRVATSNQQQLVVFDLDPVTLEIVPGSEKVKPIVSSSSNFSNKILGLELVDGPIAGELDPRYLYFTCSLIGTVSELTSTIGCWDILTNTFVPIPGVPTGTAATEYQYSHIERDETGDLYLAINDRLSRITGPDVPSTSSFTSTVIPLYYPANNFEWNEIFPPVQTKHSLSELEE